MIAILLASALLQMFIAAALAGASIWNAAKASVWSFFVLSVVAYGLNEATDAHDMAQSMLNGAAAGAIVATLIVIARVVRRLSR